MEDTAYRAFFTHPTQTYHRQYEALRAIFVEGKHQRDVAEEFGFTYGSACQLVFNFRQYVRRENGSLAVSNSAIPLKNHPLPCA